jgi:hypothetical protein
VGIAALFAADGAGEGPGVEMGKARPEGLAHFLRAAHRRMSKKCAKGVLRNKDLKKRIKTMSAEINDVKDYKRFLFYLFIQLQILHGLSQSIGTR